MEWSRLLNTERRRPSRSNVLNDARTPFEKDYDRVIFCSSFRRLQDKAQVFPLERSDYVRTRLTHSLEVSTIGRALGVDVGRKLAQQGKIDPERVQDIATIVATAGLLHDIGNPPFGHFGEEAIQTWFDEQRHEKFMKELSESERMDLLKFEGNAQALRIVTHLQMLDDEYGLNLTYGTLAGMIKYPCASTEVDKCQAHTKKFGYFQSEKEAFEEISWKTGIGDKRHPLAFLMEAADDVAYSAIDVEDAVKKGVLSFQTLMEALEPALSNTDFDETLIKKPKDYYLGYKKSGLPEPGVVATQQLRIAAHSAMIRACVSAFLKNYERIMAGSFNRSLIEVSEAHVVYSSLKNLAKEQVYTEPSVVQLECVGNEVIHGLLDRLVHAVLSEKVNFDRLHESRRIDAKLCSLISQSYRYLMKLRSGDNINNNKVPTYHRLQLVTDFICGMTDSYAVDLYQRLTGVKI